MALLVALAMVSNNFPAFSYLHYLDIIGLTGGAIFLLIGLFLQEKNTLSHQEINRFCDDLTAAYMRLEARLQATRSLTLSVRDAIVACDERGMINFWNQGATALFHHAEPEAMGRSVEILMPERSRETYRQKFKQVKTNPNSMTGGKILDLTALRKDGQEIDIEMSLAGWRTEGEQFFVAVIRDISQRKHHEASSERIQQSRVAISELLRIALEPITLKEQLQQAMNVILSVPWLTIESKGSIFLFDEESQELELIVEHNLSKPLLTACARLPLGYCLCGRAAQSREIVYSNDLDHRHDVTFDGIRPHGHYCVPILSQNRLLGVVNMYLTHNHIQDPEETDFLWAIANTLAGVIERKKAENLLSHLAHHDTLTGLPNRKLFLERLDHDMARAKRMESLLAVMFLDLDKFKEVNDTMGHEVGDQLLIEVARRLKSCLRESDTIARLGGDEFTVILTVLPKPEGAVIVAKKIIAALEKPFYFPDKECHIGSSIGVSYNDWPDDTPESLLHKADTAMYAVKREGRNNFKIFDTSMEIADR
ncbi:MAG: diguanylate cyclase [Magnetococcales bacterium]|nr:diguanylate cyclase [Magnetococcales bacterium]